MHLLFERARNEVTNQAVLIKVSVDGVTCSTPICTSRGIANRSSFGDEILHRVLVHVFLQG